MSLDMKHGPEQMIQLCGTALWETHVEKRALGTGITAIESLRGISSHQANPFISFARRDVTETCGEVFAISLVYSGNSRIQAERDMYGSTRVQAGIHPHQFSWKLESGGVFTTPEALLVYSGEGLGGMSRRFHPFLRTHISASPNHQMERPSSLQFREHVCQPFNLGYELNLLNMIPEEAYLEIRITYLDEHARYHQVGTDRIYHGSILMHMGLTIDWKNGDQFSQFWYFEKI